MSPLANINSDCASLHSSVTSVRTCKLSVHVRTIQSLIPVLQYGRGFRSAGACSDKKYYYLYWVYCTLLGDFSNFSYKGGSIHALLV